MTKARNEVIEQIWNGADPFHGLNHSRFRPDMQGWNSDHVYLSDTIIQNKPKIVIELGVWKGGSTIHMARQMKDHGIDGVVISVDTWLGSWEHYEIAEWQPSLLIQNGYPNLYFTFATNVIEAGLQEYVVPLALDSGNASVLFQRKGIQADVIHIDAGHDYEAVTNDLKQWWPVLKAGGTLIADDYDSTGHSWQSVRAAVDDFLKVTPHSKFEDIPHKARFVKEP